MYRETLFAADSRFVYFILSRRFFRGEPCKGEKFGGPTDFFLLGAAGAKIGGCAGRCTGDVKLDGQ